ncbi:hypothetical protein SHIRM173S_07788 [Streptomyces hirsutus]
MPAPPVLPAAPFRAWWAQRSPAAGAAVMATGIVSVALHLAGREILSLIFLVLACAAWLGLAAEFTLRLLRERERWASEAKTPGALTAVAATAVLGTRVSALGHDALAGALLALATVLGPRRSSWSYGADAPACRGSVFLCCVATQALAVLAATLAAAESAAWLARVALVLFWFGLVLYVLALFRFDLRQVTGRPCPCPARPTPRSTPAAASHGPNSAPATWSSSTPASPTSASTSATAA